MKNRDVFKTFRQHIDPVASELGFNAQSNTGTDLPWIRKLDNRRHEIVWIQMDKWPWDAWMGSKFTVNFQNARSPKIGLSRGTKLCRIGDLLKGNYKRDAERIQNEAISKIKVPTGKQYKAEMGFESDEFILDEYREQSQPVKFGKNLGDLWLRIVVPEDVTSWAIFLSDWLPKALSDFAKLDGDQYMW